MRFDCGVRALAAACAATFTVCTHEPAFAVAAPSIEALSTLRRAYQASSEGLLPSAESLLSSSISEWKKTGQPSEEVAALFKARANVRQQLGRLNDALSDLNEAVGLLSSSEQVSPAEQQRTFVMRARVNSELRRWQEAEADYSTAIARLDALDAIEATNPFLLQERGAARSRLGAFEGAAEDALAAVVEFKDIGDKVRSLLASSDAALALYGAGDVDEGVERMRVTFSSNGKRSPATNNPDDIGLLQELSRREAEMHLAYAAHLYSSGATGEAQAQWETGCVRLEAFIQDGLQRKSDEQALRETVRVVGWRPDGA